MPNSFANLSVMVKLMLLRGWLRLDRRVSDIWILPDAPKFTRVLIALLGRVRGVEIVVWEGKSWHK